MAVTLFGAFVLIAVMAIIKTSNITSQCKKFKSRVHLMNNDVVAYQNGSPPADINRLYVISTCDGEKTLEPPPPYESIFSENHNEQVLHTPE